MGASVHLVRVGQVGSLLCALAGCGGDSSTTGSDAGAGAAGAGTAGTGGSAGGGASGASGAGGSSTAPPPASAFPELTKPTADFFCTDFDELSAIIAIPKACEVTPMGACLVSDCSWSGKSLQSAESNQTYPLAVSPSDKPTLLWKASSDPSTEWMAAEAICKGASSRFRSTAPWPSPFGEFDVSLKSSDYVSALVPKTGSIGEVFVVPKVGLSTADETVTLIVRNDLRSAMCSADADGTVRVDPQVIAWLANGATKFKAYAMRDARRHADAGGMAVTFRRGVSLGKLAGSAVEFQ